MKDKLSKRQEELLNMMQFGKWYTPETLPNVKRGTVQVLVKKGRIELASQAQQFQSEFPQKHLRVVYVDVIRRIERPDDLLEIEWYCGLYYGEPKWHGGTEVYEPDECGNTFATYVTRQDWIDDCGVGTKCPRCGGELTKTYDCPEVNQDFISPASYDDQKRCPHCGTVKTHLDVRHQEMRLCENCGATFTPGAEIDNPD